MKTLIPLSEYVEFQEKVIPAEENGPINDWNRIFMRRIISYTRFIRQPLTLSMFVPVDDEGNFMEEFKSPLKCNYWSDNDTVFSAELYRHNLDKYRKYQKAKEKVLFDGFHIQWRSEIIIGVKRDKDLSIAFDKKTGQQLGVKQNIEWLCDYGLPLTPSALKIIGIEE